MIALEVNGERVEVDDGTSLAELVRARVERVAGVAVAVDREVVPRSAWADTPLADGARIEILVAAQGG